MSRFCLLKRLRLQALRFIGSQHYNSQLDNGERRLSSLLRKSFPDAVEINVSDISGGCGAMYEITVESDNFKGKNRVQQHRMVNEALKEEIKDMHGLRILTSIPKE